MTKWLFLLVACLLVLPAAADDPAQANRLLVEAVQLIKAAETESGASEKLALLEDAIAKLNEIIEQHPSSSLAVKLVTDQPIGSLSFAELTEDAEKLRIEVARRQLEEKQAAKGPHLAAVGKGTNFFMQIDVASLAETSFGQDLYGVYSRFLETSVDELARRVMIVLFTHLRDTVWVVLAADLSHVDQEEELEKIADSFVLQFTSDIGFDIPGMMQELNALRPDSAAWRVKEAFTEEQHQAYRVVPPDDDPFYVLPGSDDRAFFVGLRLEPLTAAMRRHASGNLVDVDNLIKLGVPDAHVSLSALLSRSMRERLKDTHLVERYAGMPDLPLSEIMANVFEVGHVLVEADADRHVTVSLELTMDTAMSANVFYVLGNTLVLPVLQLMEEGLFVSEPVLGLENLNLTWRFEFNGDVLLQQFEKSLKDREPAKEPAARTQNPNGESVE